MLFKTVFVHKIYNVLYEILLKFKKIYLLHFCIHTRKNLIFWNNFDKCKKYLLNFQWQGVVENTRFL